MDDNFFDLGGHSLLATRVVSRVRAGARRGAAAARAVRGAHGGGAGRARWRRCAARAAGAAADRAGGRATAPLPLSFAQERLWFLDRLEPGSAAYNIPVRAAPARRAGPAALERALGEIVRRHEALRTTFARGGRRAGAGDRALRAASRCRWSDLSALAEAEREAEVRRRAGEEARAAVRPGARARSSAPRCCGWAPEEHVLLLAHAPHRQRRVEHGRALPRAGGAVRRVPRRAARRRSPSCRCSTPTTPCGSASSCAGEVLERQLAYWRERLAGAPALLELPDRPSRARAVQTYRGARVPVRAPGRAAASGCRRWAAARAPRCTWCCWPPSRCCSRRYAGSEDVVVGTPDRRAHAARGGGADRLLRQHAGAAHRPLGRPGLPRGCWGGCARRRWARTSTRTCPSRAGGASCSRSAA